MKLSGIIFYYQIATFDISCVPNFQNCLCENLCFHSGRLTGSYIQHFQRQHFCFASFSIVDYLFDSFEASPLVRKIEWFKHMRKWSVVACYPAHWRFQTHETVLLDIRKRKLILLIPPFTYNLAETYCFTFYYPH